MTADHDWSDHAPDTMVNALLRTSALRRLYLDSAQFHAQIHTIVALAPTVIDALAADAIEVEAATKAAIRAAESAPTMVGHRIVPAHATLIERIDAERAARYDAAVAHEPYRFAEQRGGDRSRDDAVHWCDYCVGYYGVPHDGHHPAAGLIGPMDPDRDLCPLASRWCACVDSAVINNRWLLTGKDQTV